MSARGGVVVCGHDGLAHLSIVQYVGFLQLPVPVATLEVDQELAYMIAARLIEAVGTTDLLDEQLRAGKTEARRGALKEVRAALLEELALGHPEFPVEFVAGMTAGINTAVQRIDALRQQEGAS